jgi:altered-inheritance-of-mitochondria protein 13
MGANGSRPAAESGPSQHIFSAETPIRLSGELIDSLQSNPETDGARARRLELKIQSRVTEELRKLEREESQRLTELTDRIAAETAPSQSHSDSNSLQDSHNTSNSSSSSSSSSPSHNQNQDQPSTVSKIRSALTGGSNDNNKPTPKSEMSRDVVASEIAALREKLAQRKKLHADSKADEDVEKAKSKLVTCLRANDRRPLDCWAEVEAFRTEVGRLEREFVRNTIR